MKKQQNGFSLIELLIVVLIIGIIAAIAIPGFMASRRSANEGSAVSTLRLLHGVQMTYSTSYGEGQFAGDIGGGTLGALSTLRGREMIDDVIASGIKSGYNLVGGRENSSATSPAQFFFSAIPISTDPIMGTGSRRYGVSTDGVMRADELPTSHYANTAAVVAASPMGN